MSALVRVPDADYRRTLDDLIARGLLPPDIAAEAFATHRMFRHGERGPGRDGKPLGKPGERTLTVTVSREHYEINTAFRHFFGVRDWQHAAVSVYGALHVRLEDQRAIGRERQAGERSPAPLPDWYELTHLVYDHGIELGFDLRQPVYQYFPALGEDYLNIAEALHLRQPK